MIALRRTLFVLCGALFCLNAFADSFVPKPNAPIKFEDLVGRTISIISDSDIVSGFYWETPDTIWIKKVKHPKVGKHYRLEKNPYMGSLTVEEKFSPIPTSSFLFSQMTPVNTGITNAVQLEGQVFSVLRVEREVHGSSSLVYSNDYRISIVRIHLRRESNGDLLFWELFKSESKSFSTRTNYDNISISLSDIADAAYSSLTLKDYYKGTGSIEEFKPCHIEGAKYLSRISMSSYSPELQGTLFFYGEYDDGTSFEFDNDSKGIITVAEYNQRMELRIRDLANQGHYETNLLKVKKPANAKIRNGKLTEEEAEGQSMYVDNYLTFIVGALEKEIVLFVQNKTDYTMKVLWEEAAFITPGGSSQRIVHTSGVSYINRNNPQAPSVIPGNSILNDHVVPVGNINRSSYSGDIYFAPLIDGRTTKDKYRPGTTFSLLLPIQINGVTNEYLFTFVLDWQYDNPEIREEYLKTHPE